MALLSLLLVAGSAVPVGTIGPEARGLRTPPFGGSSAQSTISVRFSDAVDRPSAIQSAGRQQQGEHPVLLGASETHFGGTLALAGNTTIIGAPGTITHRGTAYIFRYVGAHWQLQATLAPRDVRPADFFGRKVVLSGDTALVTAPGMNNGAGAAYVYLRRGSHWIQQAKLVVPGGASDDNFASSAALDGDTALLGAWGENNGAGAAYIFLRHGTRWTQTARLAARDGAAHAAFGNSVALHGATALVGAWLADGSTGAAYVFTGSGVDWMQQAVLKPGNGTGENWFGASVALDADTAVIGAPETAAATGTVHVFVRLGSRWALRTKLSAIDKAPGDWFGRVVALSGNTILVGAWGTRNNTGTAYLFRGNGGVWLQQTELRADDGRPADYFAGSVALTGGIALVGAWGKAGGSGAVYAFTGPNYGYIRLNQVRDNRITSWWIVRSAQTPGRIQVTNPAWVDHTAGK